MNLFFPQLLEAALFLHQSIEGPALCHLASLQDDDQVSILHGLQPVRYYSA